MENHLYTLRGFIMALFFEIFNIGVGLFCIWVIAYPKILNLVILTLVMIIALLIYIIIKMKNKLINL